MTLRAPVDWTLAAGFAVGGAALGALYLAMLRRSLAARKARLLTLTLGRVLAAIVVFGIAARFGAFPLLAAFVGFLLVRALALRTLREAA